MGELCDLNLLSSVNGLEVNLKYVVLSVGHNSLKTFLSQFPQVIVCLFVFKKVTYINLL